MRKTHRSQTSTVTRIPAVPRCTDCVRCTRRPCIPAVLRASADLTCGALARQEDVAPPPLVVARPAAQAGRQGHPHLPRPRKDRGPPRHLCRRHHLRGGRARLRDRLLPALPLPRARLLPAARCRRRRRGGRLARRQWREGGGGPAAERALHRVCGGAT